jgi:glycosyltransferase involved in cell wall biosynthesis
MASYMPLRQYFADIRSEEIKGLLEKPHAYFSRVKDAQEIIEAQFTKEAIAKRWLSLIEAEDKLNRRSKNLVESVLTQTFAPAKLQILIITYNQEILCRRMIQNIESYVSKDIEVLIQDDSSQDRTYEILAKHFEANSHVRIFRNEKNLGASRNSASLISKANSEYVLNLGGDDFVIPEEIFKVTELLTRDNFDVGIFNCAHTDLAIIDYLILGKPKTTSHLNVLLRNNQFTEAVQLSEVSFYEKIATMPGALWGQGVVFRTDLLQKIKLLESSNVEEWGLFHNLAVYTQKHTVRTKFFKSIISLLAVMKNSRGSNAEAQLTRQLCAVANDWDESYRKTALINVLEKKLKQFRNSNLCADDVITAFKNSFSEVCPRVRHECVE